MNQSAPENEHQLKQMQNMEEKVDMLTGMVKDLYSQHD